VDAYGVATYQEVNPGPFTIITFPFLFAVMFGDLGHGFIMFAFAAWLCWKEKSLENVQGGGEIWDTIFGGRYIVLLMGLFSMYTGLIYNDCFSKPMTLVASGWEMPKYEYVEGEDQFDMNPRANVTDTYKIDGVDVPICEVTGCFKYAYPFGIDPIWALAENKLTFTNSFKMKMSVLLGVMQMGFGVVLGYFNGKFFKRPLDVWHMFLPQIMFLMSIFGYLCIMIIYKWITVDFPSEGGNPPSLLLMLINMFLKLGSGVEQAEILYGDSAGHTQTFIQTGLVLLALICVPWMLLVKPLTLKKQIAARAQERAAFEDNDHDDDHDDEHGFGEIMVHQAIHTIEFCLGCISNTASYLRLWALSLAHAELSEVLWQMILENCWHMAGSHPALGPIILYAGFAVWAVLTICVLLIMEGLSAFLHALRLHWVEFQNKFYEGTGYLFHPFAFSTILNSDEDELH